MLIYQGQGIIGRPPPMYAFPTKSVQAGPQWIVRRSLILVLPPCTNYDLWRRPSWRKNYDRPLDEDPCPDCDVRFRFENNEWHAKGKFFKNF